MSNSLRMDCFIEINTTSFAQPPSQYIDPARSMVAEATAATYNSVNSTESCQHGKAAGNNNINRTKKSKIRASPMKHNYQDHWNDPVYDRPDYCPPADAKQIMGCPENNNGTFEIKRMRKGPRGGVVEPFPMKLHEMLSNADNEKIADIVSWQLHGRCFVIHKPRKFVEQVMPQYFKQSKFTSFQRQVNLYGFRRLTRGTDKGGYYHELFLRGRPDLSKRMIRKRIKGTGTKSSFLPETEPNFYSMEICYSSSSRNAEAKKKNKTSECSTNSKAMISSSRIGSGYDGPLSSSTKTCSAVEDALCLNSCIQGSCKSGVELMVPSNLVQVNSGDPLYSRLNNNSGELNTNFPEEPMHQRSSSSVPLSQQPIRPGQPSFYKKSIPQLPPIGPPTLSDMVQNIVCPPNPDIDYGSFTSPSSCTIGPGLITTTRPASSHAQYPVSGSVLPGPPSLPHPNIVTGQPVVGCAKSTVSDYGITNTAITTGMELVPPSNTSTIKTKAMLGKKRAARMDRTPILCTTSTTFEHGYHQWMDTTSFPVRLPVPVDASARSWNQNGLAKNNTEATLSPPNKTESTLLTPPNSLHWSSSSTLAHHYPVRATESSTCVSSADNKTTIKTPIKNNGRREEEDVDFLENLQFYFQDDNPF